MSTEFLSISAPALAIFSAQSYGCTMSESDRNEGFFLNFEWAITNARSFTMRMHSDD